MLMCPGCFIAGTSGSASTTIATDTENEVTPATTECSVAYENVAYVAPGDALWPLAAGV